MSYVELALEAERRILGVQAPGPKRNKRGKRRKAGDDLVERFGVEHARIYPFLNCPVRTPEGEGVLLQVLGGKAVVLLEHSEDRTRRFDWRDVEAVT